MSVKYLDKFDIDAPINQSLKFLNKWLDEEQLHMDERKKAKAAALLARHFQDGKDLDEHLVCQYLANLGGGGFVVDPDDPDSVEIEIQRLLGHTESAHTHYDKKFMKNGLLCLIITMALMGMNLIALSIYILTQ